MTIKVSFRLLNLTLESPLTTTPTPYFPCKPLDSSYGFWFFGRAFLQAAFLGVDVEHDVTYLAQAPGPAMGKGDIKAFRADVAGPPETGLISEFESSWRSSWTVLDSDWKAVESENGGFRVSLSAGGIIGIAMAVLAVVW